MKMKNILRTMPAKIIIYLLTCIMMITTLISVGIGIGCYEIGLYDHTPEELLQWEIDERTLDDVHILMSNILSYMTETGELPDSYYDRNIYMGIADNLMYSVVFSDGRVLRQSSRQFENDNVKYTYYLVENESADGEQAVKWNVENLSTEKESDAAKYITIYAYYNGNDGMPNEASFNLEKKFYGYLYKYRNDALPLGIISVLLALIFYIMMLCVSARRPKSEEVYPGYFNKVPFDVLLAAALCVGGIFVGILTDCPEDIAIVTACFALVCAVIFFNGLSMSAAARIKQGTLLSNTLIVMVCKWCWKFIKKYVFGFIGWVWKLPGKMLRGIGEIFRTVPLVWKSILIFCVISFIDLVAIIIIGWDWDEWDVYAMFWVFEHIVLLVLVCRFMLGLRSLQAGGRALAEGDLDHKVDTGKLVLDFKEHGENLNHISEGMTNAVEEKMKSERMKTELITNVSHDIKTPLTSIINYADLIGKEQTDNEKIAEYTEVLLRQSERLKRLIEDLVEASKASTGNLEVELAPCEASMFITQIAGEYEEKFAKSKLTLITKGTDKSVKIMADGRRMLRVFDNLMNNICKYALENSRVYLSLEVSDIENRYHMTDVVSDGIKDALARFSKKGNEPDESDIGNKEKSRLAVITFKNTSRQELDMSPEELMERFVRGDQSRNTEGNGLGLSIARSLTELQGGTFDISIDGDLFKVILTFPAK